MTLGIVGISEMQKCALKYVIHSPGAGTEHKKAEPRTPHFLSLNQDIVVYSQEQKCGLKYVIYIL